MEQARHYTCKQCFSPVPTGHKFCGKCGTPVDPADLPADPTFFGDLQAPGKAKLILIKGAGMDGVSYHLNSTEHVAGRQKGDIVFGDDKWLSPVHANFFYDNGQLMVRDENSINGVFLCLRQPIEIPPGTVIMAGEQLFRVEETPAFEDTPDADGTYFFASPRRDWPFRLVQILEGGGSGMVVHARDGQILVGRDNCDMNFPIDPYMSARHFKIEVVRGVLNLTDMGSKNGTFVRISYNQPLVHGDYMFLGHQLLRVETT